MLRPGSTRYSYDVLVYGMPIHRIERRPYAGLYGNATRAFGLANNFAKMGQRTALVVEPGFRATPSQCLCPTLDFVDRREFAQVAARSRVLLMAFTHFHSFLHLFDRDPFVPHPRKFCVCCFDQNAEFAFGRLLDEVFGITFNNELQKSFWNRRCTHIPSHVVSYGVDESDYVDEAIRDVRELSAIWMGEIRRTDVLERIVRFAEANPDCVVHVVTRKIFDNRLAEDAYGGRKNAYADFSKSGSPEGLERVVDELLGRQAPGNLSYLGMAEGENPDFLGRHGIGLDFSRCPGQTHDNSKVLDYLRSGLAVICDDDAPSFRYVNEFRHGYVLPQVNTASDMRRAFAACRHMTSYARRRAVAKAVRDRYGWDRIAHRIAGIMAQDEKQRHKIRVKRAIQRLCGPATRLVFRAAGALPIGRIWL